MKSSMIKNSFIFIIAVVILSFGLKLYFDNEIGPVSSVNATVKIDIPTGASTSKIGKILKENHLIKNDLAFRLLSKYLKADGKMQAGSYLLKGNMSAHDIIQLLIKGEVVNNTVKFTIPEGFEFHQIVDRLESKGLINRERFIQIADYGDFDYEFLSDIPKGKNRLEGFLFPDTYEVSENTTEEEIINKMLNRFNSIFNNSYYARADELNMSVNDIVTLASIIEREAKLDKERPIVSSVFYNRVKKGIFLQSCATVQYVLGERKENLTLKDIAIDSPYNTYKYPGLPPKPIASPGKSSIDAALFPEETDYLYFVVGKEGGHIFSKTYGEHLKAKNAN